MISKPAIIIEQSNVPALLWYMECLLYYDIWLEVPTLFLYALVPALLLLPDLNQEHSACFIMIQAVPTQFIYTDCLLYYDICQK